MKKCLLPVLFIFFSLSLIANENEFNIDMEDVSFTLKIVPVPTEGISFPIGYDNSAIASIHNAYWIGETEITWKTWKNVYDWSINNGFTFLNPGRQGGDKSENGPIGNTQHPVTTISWYDAIIWCNAMTAYYNIKNDSNLRSVYLVNNIPIKDAIDRKSRNSVVQDKSANGFRLPTSQEWELAARWRNDDVNAVEGFSSPWFTNGNSASGAVADKNNADASEKMAVFKKESTAEVKSLGTVSTNSLGLYDMSGNVWEWCFEKSLDREGHIHRGGCWKYGSGASQIASYDAFERETGTDSIVGFRIAKND